MIRFVYLNSSMLETIDVFVALWKAKELLYSLIADMFMVVQVSSSLHECQYYKKDSKIHKYVREMQIRRVY